MAARVPKSITEYCMSDKATTQEKGFEMVLWDVDSGSRVILKELIEDFKKAGMPVDPAFLYPERYTLPKNEVKDGSEHDCTTENCE